MRINPGACTESPSPAGIVDLSGLDSFGGTATREVTLSGHRLTTIWSGRRPFALPVWGGNTRSGPAAGTKPSRGHRSAYPEPHVSMVRADTVSSDATGETSEKPVRLHHGEAGAKWLRHNSVSTAQPIPAGASCQPDARVTRRGDRGERCADRCGRNWFRQDHIAVQDRALARPRPDRAHPATPL